MLSCGRTIALEVSVKGVFIFPIDLYLFEDWEIWLKSVSWADEADAIHDLRAIGPWLLLPKIVTGEAQYREVGVRLLNRIHIVVLFGVTSVGGYIHNQDHLSSVVLQ